MGDKKVVSVSDRIPALKEQRKKRANRRLILYLTIFFFLITTVVYFQSPLSHVRSIDIEGLEAGEEADIHAASGLQTGVNIWTADLSGAVEGIEQIPYIEEVSISRSFPASIRIDVGERERLAYLYQDEAFTPVFAGGESMPEQSLDRLPADAPVLYGWESEEQLAVFLDELAQLGEGIANRISEVHPGEDSENTLRLFMNDGIEVETTVNNFSRYMASYPLVFQELDLNEQGVLHMKMSPYFESFAPVEDEEEFSDEDFEMVE